MGPKISKISSGTKLKLFGADLLNLEVMLVPERILGGPWGVPGGVPGGSLGVPGGSLEGPWGSWGVPESLGGLSGSQNRSKMTLMTQLGANLRPTWANLEPTWGQHGANLGKIWLKYPPKWVQNQLKIAWMCVVNAFIVFRLIHHRF